MLKSRENSAKINVLGQGTSLTLQKALHTVMLLKSAIGQAAWTWACECIQGEQKKSHTCEGGTHFGVSFWHLMLNFEKSEKPEFWKNEKKNCRRFYTCVPKTTIRWGTVPEIQTKMFFCHLGHFFPFFSPSPENQNFEKMKKAFGDVIIWNSCNKKDDRMMYAYSDMECNRYFSSIEAIFCFFTHYWPRKLKFGKNVKNTWRYYPFTHVHHKLRSFDIWFLT